MPWCPNCKTEYREGITHCADCKAELVADLNVREEKLKNATELVTRVEANQSAFLQKLAAFLDYSKVPSAILEEQDGMLALYTAPEDFSTAKRLFKAFYSVEAEHMQKAAEEAFLAGNEVEEAFFAEENGSISASHTTMTESKEAFPTERKKTEETSEQHYGSAVSRYEDYRSSCSVFFVLGIWGELTALLNLFGVFSTFNTFSSIVLAIFFAFFLGMGNFSYRKARILKGEAQKEKQLSEEIRRWLENSITENVLHGFDEISMKSLAEGTEEDFIRTEDILYLNRIDGICQSITTYFPEINSSLAEQLAEEFYAEHFEITEETE